MRIFSWVTKDTNINFMGMRKPAYVFSSLLVVLSVICIAAVTTIPSATQRESAMEDIFIK
mgnify:CR=1 FL=1